MKRRERGLSRHCPAPSQRWRWKGTRVLLPWSWARPGCDANAARAGRAPGKPRNRSLPGQRRDTGVTHVPRGPALGICHRPEEGRAEAPDGGREVATGWAFLLSGRERYKPDGKGPGGFEPQSRPRARHPEPADRKGVLVSPKHRLPQSGGPHRAGTARHREG